MALKIVKIVGWVWVVAGFLVLVENFLMKIIPEQYLDTRYLSSQIQDYNDILIAIGSIVIGIGLLKLLKLVRIIAILVCLVFLLNYFWGIFKFQKYLWLDLVFTIPQLIILNLKSIKAQFKNHK